MGRGRGRTFGSGSRWVRPHVGQPASHLQSQESAANWAYRLRAKIKRAVDRDVTRTLARGRCAVLAVFRLVSTITKADTLCPGSKFVAFGFGDAVLADFVEQGLVTDLEQHRRLLAVPVRLIQSAGDGLGFGFIFSAASY